jgi:ParB family chromosome partitioning protein
MRRAPQQAPDDQRLARIESSFEPFVRLENIRESPLNPRKVFRDMELLTESVREKGVITPLLLRTTGEVDQPFEIAAGHRRHRAAVAAGVTAVPAVIRDMSDAEFLELLITENNQRVDVHALEEASGYQALLKIRGYDVGKIAAKVGRSPKYVYDRLKLLELIPAAEKLFLEDRFTAGHAILLARLKPEDQKRAIAVDRSDSGWGGGRRNLFVSAGSLPWDDDDFEKRAKKDPYLRVKPVSVREFEAWIEDNVKFDRALADPMLFPETAELLEQAELEKLKVIPVTRSYGAGAEVRQIAKGERIYGEQAWKRADGKEGSKACSSTKVGLVACGQGQGEAFRVCIDKEKCGIHWGAWQKERKKSRKASGDGESLTALRERNTEAMRKAEAERARVDKALPDVLHAIAAAVKKVPTGSSSQLGKIVLERVTGWRGFHAPSYLAKRGVDPSKVMPPGQTAQDLVRHIAFWAIVQDFVDDIVAVPELVKRAHAFGVDAKKILDEVAPVEKPKSADAVKPTRGTCRKCGCTEEKACVGGCGWIDKSESRCSTCFKPSVKSGGKKKGRT